ncbi:hypothetical protein C9426_01075 [Serratia sp. S1B]|nr:hypothetical protein C9426_01075 [Serratia sp. S1B]
MKISKTPLITLSQFERISQIIRAIINVENGDETRSCIVFAAIGTHILRRVFKLDAKAVLGKAVYALPNSGIIAYHDVSPSTSNFHCWIEANGWFFDFSSIVFPEITSSMGLPPSQRLMLQKPLSTISNTIPETYDTFSFYLIPDYGNILTVAEFVNKQGFIDLCNIAVEWYKTPPKRLKSPPIIRNQFGDEKAAVFRGNIQGVW